MKPKRVRERTYKSLQTLMIQAVCSAMKRWYGVKVQCSIKGVPYDLDSSIVTFLLPGDEKFRFWKDVSLPIARHDDYLLHLVPVYHPVANNCERVHLLNGDSDALIACPDGGIDYVYSPIESRSTAKSIFGTWPYMKHPFYAEGKSFSVRVKLPKVLSRSGYDFLISILRGALNQESMYIGVSGGFEVPYPYPQSKTFRVRGSEHACVWEYQTLVKEGKLDGSIVPKWFKDEKWLEEYESAGHVLK